SGPSETCPPLPTRSRRPVATAPRSWATCAGRGRTAAAAGCSICYWANPESEGWVMSMYYVLDAAGEPVPCDAWTWRQWFEHDANRQIRLTEEPEFYVSTIFLGFDGRVRRSAPSPPLLWENMAFFEDGRTALQERFATRAEALEGHRRMVEEAR